MTIATAAPPTPYPTPWLCDTNAALVSGALVGEGDSVADTDLEGVTDRVTVRVAVPVPVAVGEAAWVGVSVGVPVSEEPYEGVSDGVPVGDGAYDAEHDAVPPAMGSGSTHTSPAAQHSSFADSGSVPQHVVPAAQQ